MSEITLALIKPDAVLKGVAGIILHRMNEIGTVCDVICSKWSGGLVADFYGAHRDREFFSDLVAFMTSGPIYAVTLVGPGVVGRWREVMGPTNPVVAPDSTIRGFFGSKTGPMMHNAVHGSDSEPNAIREIDMIRMAARREIHTPLPTETDRHHHRLSLFGDLGMALVQQQTRQERREAEELPEEAEPR